MITKTVSARHRIMTLAVICVASVLESAGQQASCPDCVKSDGPIQPNATNGTTNGRTNVNVCVGSNWGSDASNILSAISSAASAWNNATGSSGSTDVIPFMLQLSSSNCDVVVNKSDTVPCASAITSNGPMSPSNQGEIKLHSTAANSANLTWAITHELGHIMGLENSDQVSSSCGANTIMGHLNQVQGQHQNCQGTPAQSTIQATDVDAVQKKRDASSTCFFEEPSGGMVLCPCGSVNCPDFDESCIDLELDILDDTPEPPPPVDCYARYEITDYFSCNSTGCVYLYSDILFLGIFCYAQ